MKKPFAILVVCMISPGIAASGARPKGQYKQKARSQITAVAEGNEKTAAANCEKFLAKFPNDLEHLYVLAIA